MARDIRIIPVPLTIARYSTACGRVDRGRCLACEMALELHQPAVDLPDRVIGVCEGCGRWYLVELIPGLHEVVMVLLPEPGRLADGAAPPPPLKRGMRGS